MLVITHPKRDKHFRCWKYKYKYPHHSETNICPLDLSFNICFCIDQKPAQSMVVLLLLLNQNVIFKNNNNLWLHFANPWYISQISKVLLKEIILVIIELCRMYPDLLKYVFVVLHFIQYSLSDLLKTDRTERYCLFVKYVTMIDLVNPFGTSQQKKKITLKKSHALLLAREMKEKGEQIQKKSHKLLTEREMKRNKEKSQRNHKNGGEIKKT